jgi:hypothetical protein
MFGFKSKSANDTSDITGSYDETEFRPAELTADTPTGLTTQRSPRTLSIVSDDIIDALHEEARYVLIPRYGFPDPEDHEILRQGKNIHNGDLYPLRNALEITCHR